MKNIKIEIEYSQDYELFSLYPNNRPIKQAWVSKLVDNIKKKDLHQPIQVNDEFQILDGQHRFFAYKKLNLPVPYFITKVLTESDIANLNSTTSRWSDKDYLHYWVGKEIDEERNSNGKTNHGDYRTAEWFIDKYKLGVHFSVLLLTTVANINSSGFTEGTMKVQNLELAKMRAEFILSLEPYFKEYKKSGFLMGLLYLMRHRDFDLDRMYKAISKNSADMHGQSSRNGYIANLLRVYNKGLNASKQFNKTTFNNTRVDEVAEDLKNKF